MNFDIEKVKNIAIEAGKLIMEIYSKQDEQIQINRKEDGSFVTQADIIAHKFITKKLSLLSDLPILSEESPIEYEVRKHWSAYWLVDPLDGTKDFIAKNGEFTVNIALIEGHKPVLGVVYVPVSKDIYYAQKAHGAYKNGTKIYNNSKRIKLIGSDSNFHSTKQTKDFFAKNNISQIKRYGSSIKICKLSEGIIDVYPRFNGTKEWDTGASQSIANEAGCKLIDIKTKKELIYNKQNIANNHFIASRSDLEFDI